MPIVRNYVQQIEQKPLPGVRRGRQPIGQVDAPVLRVNPTAEAFGASVGETLANAGQALYSVHQQRQQEFQLKEDVRAAEAGARALKAWEITDVDHPENGMLAQARGAAAKDLLTAVPEAFSKKRGELWTSLSNDRQKEMFDKLADEHALQLDRKVFSFAAKETEEAAMQETEAGIATARASAISNASDMQRVGQEIDTIKNLIANDAGLNRLGPKYTALKTQVEVGKAHVGVVERMLAQGQDLVAQEYYKQHKDELFGDQITALETKLEVSNTETYGAMAADEIWQAHGPKSDLEPASIDIMLEQARKVFPNEPKKYKAAADALKERVNAFNVGRQQRQATATADVWKNVEQGADLDTVRHMPQYLQLPGDVQNAIKEHIVDRGASLEDRDRRNLEWKWTLQDRPYTVAQRNRTLRNQAEQDEAAKNWEWYWRYHEVVGKMTDDEIIALTPTLGRVIANELMKDKKSLENKPAKVFAGSIDQDLFKELTSSMIGPTAFDPPSKQTPANRAAMGRMKVAIEAAIGVEEESKKRKLTLEEQRAVGQSMLDRQVLINSPFWFDSRMPAAAVPPEQVGRTYVPTSEIPKGFTSKVDELSKMFGSHFDTWGLEHAYALQLRGDYVGASQSLHLSPSVGADKIPADERRKIEAALREEGVAVTEQAIVRLYILTQISRIGR